MIAHRLETKPHEPSVRFYRTIALSFLILTVVLLGVVIFITTKKATINIIAKEDTKNFDLAVTVDNQALGGNSLPGTVTSSVIAYSKTYYPTGEKSVTGVSKGEVTLYNKTNLAQALVATTRLLTASGTLFRLSDRVMVPANGQVNAKVYADVEGVSSDIGPSQFSIPGLSSDKQKMIYAASTQNMSGGSKHIGILTENDLQTARADYASKIKDDFLAGNQVAGKKSAISIINQNTEADKKVGDEVSEFTLSGTSTVVAVWYDKNELDNLLKRLTASNFESEIEKINSVGAEPKVSVTGYDLAKNTAQLAVSQNLTVTLNPDAAKLSTDNFLGKNKDQIQRYVLGLDHVSGVEVNFTPAWMMSAPSIPNRVKVVVKYVR